MLGGTTTWGKYYLRGSGTQYSLPAVFSTLRGQLVKDIEANKDSWNPITLVKVAYEEAWLKDIDDGLAALPQMSDQLAKALFFNPTGMDVDKVKGIAKDYTTNHLIAMQGVPKFVGITIGGLLDAAAFVDYILGLINIKQIFKEIERDLLNYLLMKTFGMTIDDIEKYAKDAGTLFAQNVILNTGEGQHIDISTFNKQELHISDPGNTNPNEFFDYQKFPAAYNAVTMIKLALMSKDAVNGLLTTLTQQYDPSSTPPVLSKPNVMLGFMETLDGSNQWNANPNKMVVAQNLKLYQAIFMSQSGEESPRFRDPIDTNVSAFQAIDKNTILFSSPTAIFGWRMHRLARKTAHKWVPMSALFKPLTKTPLYVFKRTALCIYGTDMVAAWWIAMSRLFKPLTIPTFWFFSPVALFGWTSDSRLTRAYKWIPTSALFKPLIRTPFLFFSPAALFGWRITLLTPTTAYKRPRLPMSALFKLLTRIPFCLSQRTTL